MATFQRYTVSFFVVGFGWRQLATLPGKEEQAELIKFIVNTGGRPDGDWYRFLELQKFSNAITKTRQLGGIVYDLPVKLGV
jgi:hypothetical protein